LERGGLIVLWLAATACRPDPAALDQAELKAAMTADDALDRALKQADDAERANRDTDALNILKRTCEPEAEHAVAVAGGLAPRTAWGRKQKDGLVALERDRKAELARYEGALASGDPEKKLAAIESQLGVERRAVELSEEIDHGP